MLGQPGEDSRNFAPAGELGRAANWPADFNFQYTLQRDRGAGLYPVTHAPLLFPPVPRCANAPPAAYSRSIHSFGAEASVLPTPTPMSRAGL